MDDVAWARDVAAEALADVDPAGLRNRAQTLLTEGSTAPAVLTLVSARAVDPEIEREAVAGRAAGVQLIYDGLGLTRRLSEGEPWTDPTMDSDQADLDVIVADVLVARGFYLLARTEAADRAVETVRAFGRDQTARLQAVEEAPEPPDPPLAESVFVMAAVAGATAAGHSHEALLHRVTELAKHYEDGPLPSAATVLDDEARESLYESVRPEAVGGDRPARSATESGGS
jgi:hypothetical protein